MSLRDVVFMEDFEPLGLGLAAKASEVLIPSMQWYGDSTNILILLVPILLGFNG